jgi:ABC-type glutathione transport system ATPase component
VQDCCFTCKLIKESDFRVDILTISSLYVDLPTDDGLVRAINGVDISITEEEVLGLIGESGCGKSVLGLSIMRLLQEDVIFKGYILYRGKNLYSIENDENMNLQPELATKYEKISDTEWRIYLRACLKIKTNLTIGIGYTHLN